MSDEVVHKLESLRDRIVLRTGRVFRLIFKTDTLTGKKLGVNAAGKQLLFGKIAGRRHGYADERSALDAALQFSRFVDDPDVAVVKRDDKYFFYEIDTKSITGKDLSTYEDLRACTFYDSYPKGHRLLCVGSENKHFRFYLGQASPREYTLPPDMTHADSLATLRKKAVANHERLVGMTRDLGATKDHRTVFAAAYRVITVRAIAEFDSYKQAGKPESAQFDGRLICNFARRYFAAYDAYAAGRMREVDEVWRTAFDAGRIAQAKDFSQFSVSEILLLSMCAHIIHDLALTLGAIGYDKGQLQSDTYDHFNQALIEEKDRILAAVEEHFGETDLHRLERPFTRALQAISQRFNAGDLGQDVARGAFAALRGLAKQLFHRGYSKAKIGEVALFAEDLARKGLPGGN